jgi:hypothetical protein
MAAANNWSTFLQQILGSFGGGQAGLLGAGAAAPPGVNPLGAPKLNFQTAAGLGFKPPPITAPGLTATGHWNMPDYNTLIENDPIYGATRGSLEAEAGTGARGLQSLVRNAVINFGAAPKDWVSQSGYGNVDAATAEAAANRVANPYSVMSQLADVRERGSTDLAAALAARGMLSSGSYTGGENMLRNAYDQNTSEATQQLLGALSGGEGTFANLISDIGGRGLAALGESAGRAYTNYLPNWVDETPAPPAAPPWVRETDPNPVQPISTPNPTGIPDAYGGVASGGEEAPWEVNWGALPKLTTPQQYDVPKPPPTVSGNPLKGLKVKPGQVPSSIGSYVMPKRRR